MKNINVKPGVRFGNTGIHLPSVWRRVVTGLLRMPATQTPSTYAARAKKSRECLFRLRERFSLSPELAAATQCLDFALTGIFSDAS
jgi:hypothetical protein